MKSFTGVKADDCATVSAQGAEEPILFNDSFCVPARDIYLTGLGGASDEAITGGGLILTCGQMGIFQNMTPSSMRSFAKALTAMADLADANSARMAAEALAAAGKPRS